MALIVAYFAGQYNFSFFDSFLLKASEYIDNYYFQSIMLDYFVSPTTIDGDTLKIHLANKPEELICPSIIDQIDYEELNSIIEMAHILENHNNQCILYIILEKIINIEGIIDQMMNVFDISNFSEYLQMEHYFYLEIIWMITHRNIELYPSVIDAINQNINYIHKLH